MRGTTAAVLYLISYALDRASVCGRCCATERHIALLGLLDVGGEGDFLDGPVPKYFTLALCGWLLRSDVLNLLTRLHALLLTY